MIGINEAVSMNRQFVQFGVRNMADRFSAHRIFLGLHLSARTQQHSYNIAYIDLNI